MIVNQKESARALMIFSGIWAGLVIVFALSFFELFYSPMWLRIGLAVVIGLIALFFYIGGYCYVHVEVENNANLMVKYYNLFPVGRKFKAFRIPLQNFHHHEIRFGAAGMVSKLVLFQRMQGGVAKYPPVGLSAMGKTGREKLSAFLRKLEKR
ncbi:hypothetical protein [Marinilabilia salmonicolor]|uniref:PH (Pleckstrin Homology) domain-containing protein n=1 Tax=Marinilabilia salmonicolor TaxID=989 RepID=A0A368VAH1_9BACT|nr:hypothetical protein [Marinilabilia salmonicolor]RCW36664.1 hypothetical protein DFO77_108106 [Marinilabilia salmonicolor]